MHAYKYMPFSLKNYNKEIKNKHSDQEKKTNEVEYSQE